MLILGLILSVFGLRLLFQSDFLKKYSKDDFENEDNNYFSEKDTLYYNRYVRGLWSFIGWLVMLIGALIILI